MLAVEKQKHFKMDGFHIFPEKDDGITKSRFPVFLCVLSIDFHVALISMLLEAFWMWKIQIWKDE